MSSSPKSPAQRLEDLEILFTHLQRTVHDLDQVVVGQSRRLDSLERELAILKTEVRVARDAAREPRRPEEEIPPHY